MPLRTRIFIIISIIVLFVLGISLFLIIGNRQKKALQQSTVTTTASAVVEQNNFNYNNIQSQTTIPANATVKPQTTAEAQRNAKIQLAKIFVERYATFSTDNNYDNIKDVQTLTSQAYYKKISSRIGASQTGGFTGVTAKVITANFISESAGVTTIELKVMKNQEKNNLSSTIYQTATVSLILENSVWVVNNLIWQ